MPFDVNKNDAEQYDEQLRNSSISVASTDSTNNNNQYQGVNQIEFFMNVRAFLQRRIEQDTRGSRAEEVDQKYDEALLGQVDFIDQILQENTNGVNVIKGLSADKLEHCLKSLIPVVRVGDA